MTRGREESKPGATSVYTHFWECKCGQRWTGGSENGKATAWRLHKKLCEDARQGGNLKNTAGTMVSNYIPTAQSTDRSLRNSAYRE